MIHSFCELSAAIQLAATFNLGCVALSKENSFALSVSNYFFHVDKYLKQELSNIQSRISADYASIKTMEPREIEGHDYKKDIDILKKQFEILNEFVEQKSKDIQAEISRDYAPKYLDNVCILLGLYSVYELIMSALIKMGMESYIFSFYALNLITILLFCACVIGEIVNYRHFFLGKGRIIFVDLRSAKFVVLTSVVSLVFAFLFPLINKLFVPRIFNTELIGVFHFSTGILLPFLGFFVYWIYIMYMSERAKRKIHNVAVPIIDRFNDLHENRKRIDTILTEFSVKDIDIV